MNTKGTWNWNYWNYLRVHRMPPDEPPKPSPTSITSSVGSTASRRVEGKSSRSHQNPHKLKSVSRRIAKSPPHTSLVNNSKYALALNLSKDLLIALRYLPAGVLSKLPGINFLQNTTNSVREGVPQKFAEGTPAQAVFSDVNKSVSQGQVVSTAVPIGPSNVIPPKVESLPKKTTTIVSPGGSSENVTANAKDATSSSIFSISKLFGGHYFRKQPKLFANQIRDVDLTRQHLEARTRYLISSLYKNSHTENVLNLLQIIDTLFLHIYQNIDTRPVAIDSGAIKILNHISKHYESDVNIQNRTREVLGLLGWNPPIKGNGLKILAIDGGGVRGLVAIEVLRMMEEVTGKKIHELFDFICGVSTGSILAVLIGAYRRSLDECEDLYRTLSQEVFNQNSIIGASGLVWSHAYYNTPTWEKILKKHLGEHTSLISLAKDPSLPKVAAISTVVSNERVTPYVFRTYAFPPDVTPRYSGGCRYEMWEAVRASAAAPTYFEEVKLGNHLHQDGGVMVNNPTSIALTEARTIWPDTPLQCVVSLGTGITLSSLSQEAIGDQYCHANVRDHLSDKPPKILTSLSWKGKLLKILDSATDTEAVHYTMRELLPKDVYYRFNPYLSEVMSLDESKSAKLQKAQDETKAYVEKNFLKLNAMKKALMKEKGITKKVVDWWKH